MKGAIQIREMKPTVLTEARGGNILLRTMQTFIDLVMTGGVEAGTPGTDGLLLENGDFRLLENGDKLLLG